MRKQCPAVALRSTTDSLRWLDRTGSASARSRGVRRFRADARLRRCGQFLPRACGGRGRNRRPPRFKVVGEVEGARNDFYAITAERRLKHPAILAVTENAQLRLFT